MGRTEVLRSLRSRRLAPLPLCKRALGEADGDLDRAAELLDGYLIEEVRDASGADTETARRALELKHWDVEAACRRAAWETTPHEQDDENAYAREARLQPAVDAIERSFVPLFDGGGLYGFLSNAGYEEARQVLAVFEEIGAERHALILREALELAGAPEDAPPRPTAPAIVAEWGRRVLATGDELARHSLERSSDWRYRPGPWPPERTTARLGELDRKLGCDHAELREKLDAYVGARGATRQGE